MLNWLSYQSMLNTLSQPMGALWLCVTTFFYDRALLNVGEKLWGIRFIWLWLTLIHLGQCESDWNSLEWLECLHLWRNQTSVAAHTHSTVHVDENMKVQVQDHTGMLSTYLRVLTGKIRPTSWRHLLPQAETLNTHLFIKSQTLCWTTSLRWYYCC